MQCVSEVDYMFRLTEGSLSKIEARVATLMVRGRYLVVVSQNLRVSSVVEQGMGCKAASSSFELD